MHHTRSHLLVSGNVSGQYGGGIVAWGSTSSLTNGRVVSNESGWSGGGIRLSGYTGSVANFSVVANVATSPYAGGGISLGYSFPALTNVVIAWNSAPVSGGIGAHDGSVATLVSCDLWANDPDDFGYHPNPTGTDGNVQIDPGFLAGTATNPIYWDLHLSATSPLIDAGDPTVLDPDGSPSDIGAYGGPLGAWP